MNRIAVLASGQGTTAEAFIRAAAERKINTRIELVIANNPDAGIFQRISNLNKELDIQIRTICINSKTHPAGEQEKFSKGTQTKSEENAIIKALREGDFDAVVLMGYMKKIGPDMVNEFGWRREYTIPYQANMLNTHPGLLPQTKGSYGLQAQQLTLVKHMPYGGQTLHIVAEDYDDGPVIAEHKVPISPNDNAESLFAKVQEIEKQTLPTDVDEFIKNRQNYLKAKENV